MDICNDFDNTISNLFSILSKCKEMYAVEEKKEAVAKRVNLGSELVGLLLAPLRKLFEEDRSKQL